MRSGPLRPPRHSKSPTDNYCRPPVYRGLPSAGRGVSAALHQAGGELMSQSQGSRPATTDDAGILVESDEHSLTVGPAGPLLLQDYYLIEQMAQVNRERVPERQPHAKGSGAFGHFEVTGDVSQYTRAAVFQP